MKIVTVVGARPQFIKAATVSRVLSTREDVSEVLVHTGQHYDENMSEIFFREMAIPRPTYDLGIDARSHGAMTGRQLERVEEVLLAERPDWVLVYGDTNSTLAGALAAAKLNIPVAHVEAGLRSWNRRMPEEVNRVLTDHISSLLFAPGANARENLVREGLDAQRIHVVGDVMYDAALFYRRCARQPEWFAALDLPANSFVLCTLHRAENTDDPRRLASVLEGLVAADVPVVMPLHPRTRDRLRRIEVRLEERVHVVDPVSYFEMLWLEMHCGGVATDSGGVQKEAYFQGKPCAVLRDETEWTELIAAGANVLVGVESAEVAVAVRNLLEREVDANVAYGNGRAAEAVVARLVDSAVSNDA